jgi:hypothetical protein
MVRRDASLFFGYTSHYRDNKSCQALSCNGLYLMNISKKVVHGLSMEVYQIIKEKSIEKRIATCCLILSYLCLCQQDGPLCPLCPLLHDYDTQYLMDKVDKFA